MAPKSTTPPHQRAIRSSLHNKLQGQLARITRWNNSLQWTLAGGPSVIILMDRLETFEEARDALKQAARLIDDMQSDLERSITNKEN